MDILGNVVTENPFFFLVEVVGDQTKVLLLALLKSRILVSLGVIYISELILAEEIKRYRSSVNIVSGRNLGVQLTLS
jgi:hypothetical protein